MNLNFSFPHTESFKISAKKLHLYILFTAPIQFPPNSISITYEISDNYFFRFSPNYFLTQYLLILTLIVIIMTTCLLFVRKLLVIILRQIRIRLGRIAFLNFIIDEEDIETPEERFERFLRLKLVVKKVYHEGMSLEFSQTECSFCLENYKDKEELAELFCKHFFHLECAKRWNNFHQGRNMKCPICSRLLNETAFSENLMSTSTQDSIIELENLNAE